MFRPQGGLPGGAGVGLFQPTQRGASGQSAGHPDRAWCRCAQFQPRWQRLLGGQGGRNAGARHQCPRPAQRPSRRVLRGAGRRPTQGLPLLGAHGTPAELFHRHVPAAHPRHRFPHRSAGMGWSHAGGLRIEPGWIPGPGGSRARCPCHLHLRRRAGGLRPQRRGGGSRQWLAQAGADRCRWPARRGGPADGALCGCRQLCHTRPLRGGGRDRWLHRCHLSAQQCAGRLQRPTGAEATACRCSVGPHQHAGGIALPSGGGH